LCIVGAEADKRSTIYALGCLLYEALTTKPYELPSFFTSYISANGPSQCLTWLNSLPFSREQADRSMAYAGSKVSDLESIILKCLQLNPIQRYQALVELKGDLLSTADSVPEII
jgi:serine/threonine protein kinase